MQQAGRERGRTVERIFRRQRPPGLLRTPFLAALLGRHQDGRGDVAIARKEPIDGRVTAYLFQVIDNDRPVFEPMAVGIDHGKIETGAYRLRIGVMISGHDPPSLNELSDTSTAVRESFAKHEI